MTQQALREARILIVEDKKLQLDGIKRDVENLFKDAPEALGVEKYTIHTAQDVEQAEKFLRQATNPYDVAIVDLQIPERIAEGNDLIENGQKLLERIRTQGLAKEIIVTSVWFHVDEVTRAYRNGIFDFISKPFPSAELQTRFIRCWKQLLSRESTRLLGEASTDELVQYAEKGLAHRFTACFSNLVQSIIHKNEEIEQYISERYDLNRRKDAEDPLFRVLQSQQDVVAKSQAEWTDLKNSLISANDSLRGEHVKSLFTHIRRSILPCLVVKNFELDYPDEDKYRVSTFADDVEAVMREIILGGMRAVPDYNDQKQEIRIQTEKTGKHVKLIFEDQLNPITLEDATTINRGTSIPPTRRFDRAWGLSVVQLVAMRGGGRLEIVPRTNGNLVSYYVPSTE